MFINEAKGSHGMFSRAGRNSTEKFHILMKKDEILSNKRKKAKTLDIFGDPKDYSDEEEKELIKLQKQSKLKNHSVTIEPKKKTPRKRITTAISGKK